MREYSRLQTTIANIPYAILTIVGAITILIAYDYSQYAIAGAAAYFAYGIIGAIWIMVFVCPYCAYYDTSGCPCGYGTVSAKIVKKADRTCFSEKFKRHIPVIVPLWFIPAGIGSYALWQSYSPLLLGLVVAFCIDAFVLLPLISRKHGCSDCPQKDDCPWMGKKSAASCGS